MLLALAGGLTGAASEVFAQAASAAKGAADGRERVGPALPAVGGEEPVVIEADRLQGRADRETVAEGQVDFRRGSLRIQADRIEYAQPTDTARASGGVEITRDGNRYRGPELQLKVESFEGWFLSPSYYFERIQAGGSAERFDFLDDHRGIATGATYTSCPVPDPAWILSADRVLLDNVTDEGQAEGAVLRFYGVPILALPKMSFPLSDARKSGWLPPAFNLDNKSGFELSAPYYWNIAPNLDATLTPTVYTRRGEALGAELRYLEPDYRGQVQTRMLPHDKVTGGSRWSLLIDHEARWEGRAVGAVDYGLNLQRVSDDDYWKDFSRTLPSLTPRLLPAVGQATRRIDSPYGDIVAYARVQHWQVLQDIDPLSRIVAPYQREPQIGLRQSGAAAGFEWRWETEANRFTQQDPTLQAGARVHAIGTLSRPWWPTGSSGWTVTPRLSFNAAAYDLDLPLADGRRQASRVIPTIALDSAWVFERNSQFFGRDLTQTLEPRLLYVHTPFRDQSRLPVFDSAPLDFNAYSIFADSVFSGVDRVSDAHQITAGVTTRFLDSQTGAEALRLGVAQRMLLRDQRITPDGVPITRRLSDLLLLGGSNLLPHWWVEGTVQYDADAGRVARSILSTRYSPGPLRTVNVAYRNSRVDVAQTNLPTFTGSTSDQIEVGWQWPLNGPARETAAVMLARDALARDGVSAPRMRAAANCPGAWYTVGRINYNRRDARVTDSIIGFEYDAGCWIGRVVAERLSTGRSEATTRLLFQLELIGLSRLGSNPLGTLRDNIPGYRLLREDATTFLPDYSTP